MFDTLEEVQKHSHLASQQLIAKANELGKDFFYILEVVQSIGDNDNLKYKVLIQAMDSFSKREIELLGFNTMLTRFEKSPDNKKYITTNLYHVLDKDKVEIINNMKESAFQKLLRSNTDHNVINVLKSTRQHAKRLLNGKK